MKSEKLFLPMATPQWLCSYIKSLERQIEEMTRKQERTEKQLWKNQEDFQDLLDLVERIAEDREPWIRIECQKMIERFNTGSNQWT